MVKSFVIVTVFLFSIISANSQTTYTWTGSVNSSFSTAGNWNPVRQVGLTTDILIFETGSTVNALNISSVTVGQLIVRNNTSLFISPTTGNSKTISINGSDGNDLVVDQGSSLTISGNDPSISLLIKGGATADISGTISFTGEINHSINAVDSLSLKFKNGSILNQDCPGNIFTASGINNAAVFESGSEFIVNHINALNPFGLLAPDSKVKFEKGSKFILKISALSALALSGRKYAGITIANESVITISENMTSSFAAENLIVEDGCSLNVINRYMYKSINFDLGGNLEINGGLYYNDTNASLKNIDVLLSGPENTISGTGTISFSGAERLTLSGNYSLGRDLHVACPLLISGHLNKNGHTLTSSEKFIDNSVYSGLTGDKPNNNSSSPGSFSLSQNYPNPFNPATKIDYTLASTSKVIIKVFDVTGREVMTLLDAMQEAGSYSINFDGRNLTSGAYFYNITAAGNGKTFVATKKMMLTK